MNDQFESDFAAFYEEFAHRNMAADLIPLDLIKRAMAYAFELGDHKLDVLRIQTTHYLYRELGTKLFEKDIMDTSAYLVHGVVMSAITFIREYKK